MTHTMRAGGAAGVLAAVVARGGTPARVLAAAGLAAEDLADLERMIDVARIAALFEAAARESRDDCFGLHLGEHYDFAAMGALTYAVLNAPTVETALRNFERYGRTHVTARGVVLERDGSEARLAYDIGIVDRSLCRQHAEGAAVVGLTLLRRLVRPDWRPRRVLFGHARPRDTSEHARLLGAPLQFGEPIMAALAFPAADLDRPVPGADRRLLPIVERHLDELLSSGAAPDDWLDGVRGAIAESVCDGAPAIEAIANKLALSVRTLQRRLGADGVVFKTLVDEIRRDLALRYVASGKSDLTEIAFLVGYSELSAFDRAFRRWTGSTPRAFARRAGR